LLFVVIREDHDLRVSIEPSLFLWKMSCAAEIVLAESADPSGDKDDPYCLYLFDASGNMYDEGSRHKLVTKRDNNVLHGRATQTGTGRSSRHIGCRGRCPTARIAKLSQLTRKSSPRDLALAHFFRGKWVLMKGSLFVGGKCETVQNPLHQPAPGKKRYQPHCCLKTGRVAPTQKVVLVVNGKEHVVRAETAIDLYVKLGRNAPAQTPFVVVDGGRVNWLSATLSPRKSILQRAWPAGPCRSNRPV
jgi:hypothetical protein